jgi:hypothetical protein
MTWRSCPAAPRTHAGRWLHTLHLGQWDLRDRLRGTLNKGLAWWNDDEPALVEAVCELSVRQYFGYDYDVRAVTDFVVMLRAAAKENDPYPSSRQRR